MPTEVKIPKELLAAASAAQQVKDRKEAEKQASKETFAEDVAIQADEVKAVLAVASAQSTPSADTNAILTELLKSITRREVRQIEREEREEAERQAALEAKFKEVKLNAANHAANKANAAAFQQYCNHRKEDGRPRTVGQKTSNGHYFFMCPMCKIEWDETTLPPSLQVPSEWIGG